MPHTNARSTNKKWFDYYDQRTLDLVYEMYEKDFVAFQYSPILKQRPDLKPPTEYSVSSPAEDVETASSVAVSSDENNTTTTTTTKMRWKKSPCWKKCCVIQIVRLTNRNGDVLN